MDTNKQIQLALASHKQWKARLQHAIQNGASEYQPDVVRADDRCEFGKWLYQQISPEEQQSTHYESARKLHAVFHLEAAGVLETALSGRKSEAQAGLAFGGKYDVASANLKSELIAWHVDNIKARANKSSDGLSEERVKAVLAERAQSLIKSTEMQTGEMMQLVVFTLADETYGIATEFVKEVQPLRNLTPVPCTPDFVVGVINIRGSIYSVIDIRSFFGVAKREIDDLTKVILVDAAGLELGVLADDVSGATSVLVSDIKPPLVAQSAAKDEYVLGVMPNMLIIVNLEPLLRDERIIVHQEI